ncbi:MAG: DUF721 domain-containing protein [Tatlockia sp.]|nr:DUF721 domain-containing protein [Tatlockia sp.]
MRSISRCLNAQLLDICRRSIELDELNDKVKSVLSEPLNNYCLVAAFNSGCLLITATNSAWATELRYRLPELRDQLRKAGLYQLTSIKIGLENFDTKKPQNKPLSKKLLSNSARNNIRNAGELCSYIPLRDALYHLASDASDQSD